MGTVLSVVQMRTHLERLVILLGGGTREMDDEALWGSPKLG